MADRPVFPAPSKSRRHPAVGALVFVAACAASTAAASDDCTIHYRLTGTFEVTDTQLGKGDVTTPITGSLVVEFPRGDDGRVTDGKVKVLHYAMVERFTIDSIIDVTTTVHHFSPTCNGEKEPTWRRPADAGFPERCAYTGNRKAVAVGTLDRTAGRIEWAKCKAAPSYWSRDRSAYTASEKSRGRGCLNELRAVGNVHCEGRLACKLGGLRSGDNPVSDEWAQPLVHGPPDSPSEVRISADLRIIESPVDRRVGPQSYNIPNDAPSRTWVSFVATRIDGSRFTTCEPP